ncbi:MAG: methyltransferase domain-containing protein [Gammaproteobacteria bacterium]
MDLSEWLATPQGQRLAEAEKEVAADALRRVFGAQFLQVGAWGPADAFSQLAGTGRRAVCAEGHAAGVSFLAEDHQLPVAGHTVDAVLLPHTLERSRDPHQVLRESERVLTGGGRLFVLGFDPFSFAGMRRLLTRGAWPPAVKRLVPERRLRDWLSLLNFDVTEVRRFLPAFPSSRLGRMVSFLPGYHGAYLLVAVKRVHVITSARSLWRKPARVGGLIEPTTRNGL